MKEIMVICPRVTAVFQVVEVLPDLTTCSCALCVAGILSEQSCPLGL